GDRRPRASLWRGRAARLPASLCHRHDAAALWLRAAGDGRRRPLGDDDRAAGPHGAAARPRAEGDRAETARLASRQSRRGAAPDPPRQSPHAACAAARRAAPAPPHPARRAAPERGAARLAQRRSHGVLAMRALAGTVAVVTGAASGIGRALALRLAQEGCMLALGDVDAAGLAESATAIRRIGVRVSTHQVDVSDAAAMEAFRDAVLREHGRVALLVNNAGVAVAGTVNELSLADIAWLMGINFWGVVHGVKLFLPVLQQQYDAHIVNISSVFGIVAPPGQSAYAASKFAVRGFSE